MLNELEAITVLTLGQATSLRKLFLRDTLHRAIGTDVLSEDGAQL